MAIKITITDEQVQDILVDYIESSSTAIRALKNEETYDSAYGDPQYCRRVVAQVLHMNEESGNTLIPCGDITMRSSECIAFGLRVAAYVILNR